MSDYSNLVNAELSSNCSELHVVKAYEGSPAEQVFIPSGDEPMFVLPEYTEGGGTLATGVVRNGTSNQVINVYVGVRTEDGQLIIMDESPWVFDCFMDPQLAPATTTTRPVKVTTPATSTPSTTVPVTKPAKTVVVKPAPVKTVTTVAVKPTTVPVNTLPATGTDATAGLIMLGAAFIAGGSFLMRKFRTV